VEFVLVPSKGVDRKLSAALSVEILANLRTLQGQS
jgi:hypothetical protein